MEILDNLRLTFEKPVWCKFSQLSTIDTILEAYPHIIELVKNDILNGLKNNRFGRKDGPSVEQILRAGIYKELRKLTYEELELHEYDSTMCRNFMHLNSKAFSASVLHEYISKISASNLEKVRLVSKSANFS